MSKHPTAAAFHPLARVVDAAEYDAIAADAVSLRAAIDSAIQRLNESGTGIMGLVDTINSTHNILITALKELSVPTTPARTKDAP